MSGKAEGGDGDAADTGMSGVILDFLVSVQSFIVTFTGMTADDQKRGPVFPFSVPDVRAALFRAVCEVKPYLAEHGQKGAKWKEVTSKFKNWLDAKFPARDNTYTDKQVKVNLVKKHDLSLG